MRVLLIEDEPLFQLTHEGVGIITDTDPWEEHDRYDLPHDDIMAYWKFFLFEVETGESNLESWSLECPLISLQEKLDLD